MRRAGVAPGPTGNEGRSDRRIATSRSASRSGVLPVAEQLVGVARDQMGLELHLDRRDRAVDGGGEALRGQHVQDTLRLPGEQCAER